MINLLSVSVFLPFGLLSCWRYICSHLTVSSLKQVHGYEGKQSVPCDVHRLKTCVCVWRNLQRGQLLPASPGSEAVHLIQVKQTSHWKTCMYWACPRNTAGCAHTHPHTHKQKLISTGEIQWPAALLGALSSAHLASNRPMNLLTANISFTPEGKIKGFQQSTKVQAAVDLRAKARVAGIMNVCANSPKVH